MIYYIHRMECQTEQFLSYDQFRLRAEIGITISYTGVKDNYSEENRDELTNVHRFY